MTPDNPLFNRYVQRAAAKEHFLRIRPAAALGRSPLSTELTQLNDLLQPYEEALLVDATEYRERLSDHLKNGKKFVWWGDVSHFQFLAGGDDEFTAWVVEMNVDQVKDTNLWISKQTRFTRFQTAFIPSLRRTWSDATYFLHKRRGDGYDTEVLDEGIFATTSIGTDDNGMITYIRHQEYDGTVGANTIQSIRLNRNFRPSHVSPMAGTYLTTIRTIMETLPMVGSQDNQE